MKNPNLYILWVGDEGEKKSYVPHSMINPKSAAN